MAAVLTISLLRGCPQWLYRAVELISLCRVLACLIFMFKLSYTKVMDFNVTMSGLPA